MKVQKACEYSSRNMKEEVISCVPTDGQRSTQGRIRACGAWPSCDDGGSRDVMDKQIRHVGTTSSTTSATTSLRIVQWNIERGYQLEGIVAFLRAVDADILLLQELDVHCARSGFADAPAVICDELDMYGYFAHEFEELHHSCRSYENRVRDDHPDVLAGAPLEDRGGSSLLSNKTTEFKPAFHGNAIFCKRTLGQSQLQRGRKADLPILRNPQFFEHSTGIAWSNDAKVGLPIGEPRTGSRGVLTCEAFFTTTSDDTQDDGSGVVVLEHCLQLYSLHLEVFCGALMRVQQLSDAVWHASYKQREFLAGCSASDDYKCDHESQSTTNRSSRRRRRLFSVCIGGDLNTHAHSIVRLSTKYGTDRIKLLSLGETEAEWLQRNCFLNIGKPIKKDLSSFCSSKVFLTKLSLCQCGKLHRHGFLSHWLANAIHSIQRAGWWLFFLGYDRRGGGTCCPIGDGEAVQLPAANSAAGGVVTQIMEMSTPHLALYDPFDKLTDRTLSHPSYYGFATGKLDWMLLSGRGPHMETKNHGMGNHDYSLSDHKLLYVDVELHHDGGDKKSAQLCEADALDDALEHFLPSKRHLSTSVMCIAWRFAAISAVVYGGARVMRSSSLLL